jgi:hypothetical protein
MRHVGIDVWRMDSSALRPLIINSIIEKYLLHTEKKIETIDM